MARKIPVTEFAKMGYCETLLVLNKKHKSGDQSCRDEEAINRGNKEHDAFDARVKKQHVPYRPTADKRCFIASCVYGQEHPTTERLRQFRDHSLKRTAPGRALIALYYRVSPHIVVVLDQHAAIKQLATRLLNQFVRRL